MQRKFQDWLADVSSRLAPYHRHQLNGRFLEQCLDWYSEGMAPGEAAERISARFASHALAA
jgi:hypothetical protein